MDKQFAIFDMDGTLIDSMNFWKNLASEYLTNKGITKISTNILEEIKTMTMSESAALFKQKFSLSGDPEKEMNAIMEGHYRNDIPLKKGVQKYLQKLHSEGVCMCVASAAAEDLVEVCLNRLGVRNYFAFLLSCETVGAGKRSPIVYHEAAKRMGAVPADAAVYEDALYAVETAKDAGYYVVGVYDDGTSNNWETIERIADEIILSWEDAL